MHSFGSKRVGGSVLASFSLLTRYWSFLNNITQIYMHPALASCRLLILADTCAGIAIKKKKNQKKSKNMQPCGCTRCSRSKGQGSWATEAVYSARDKGCHNQTLHIYATWSVMLMRSHIEMWPDSLLHINQNINADFKQYRFEDVSQMMHRRSKQEFWAFLAEFCTANWQKFLVLRRLLRLCVFCRSSKVWTSGKNK